MRHGLYFFASNSEDGENRYEYEYQSTDLIHPEREVVIEYIFSITRKELEKKYFDNPILYIFGSPDDHSISGGKISKYDDIIKKYSEEIG
mgnify:CR=1 FL=1